MIEQLDLPCASESDRTVNSDELDRLMYWLEQLDGWSTADVLLRWLQWPVTEANRRRIRALAEASEGRIASAPGAPGYILTRKLTPEQIHLVEGLRTQSDRMRARYIAIMRVWHSGKAPHAGSVGHHRV